MINREVLLKRAGAYIAETRKRKNITQQELLVKLDTKNSFYMDRNTLSLIERGRVATNWLFMSAIIAALDIPADEFISVVLDRHE